MRIEYTASRLIPYPVVFGFHRKKPGFSKKPGFCFENICLSSDPYPRSP